MKQIPHIVVIYDGIDNSVFDSQVIQPLLKHLNTDPKQKIILISFEKKHPGAQKIKFKIPDHPSLSFIVCKKFPFIGNATLHYSSLSLKKILAPWSTYTMQARGPFAGLLCLYASKTAQCLSLTIQARGLLAQEYAYEHAQTKGIASLWHTFRQWQLGSIERRAYSHTILHRSRSYTVQAVSKALGEYLITAYDALRSKITLATEDIPTAVSQEQLMHWKQIVRKELTIPREAIVYCYNGSIKPWQCPEQIVAYCVSQYYANNNVVLYILTQDKKQFESLIKQYAIPASAYRILSVPHKDIYRYLAAANIGLMFRQTHIVNWVSRPTKALEYLSAGLTIEHNGTVSWLHEQGKNNPAIKQVPPGFTPQKNPIGSNIAMNWNV